MILDAVVARLKAQCPAFKIIGGIAEFDTNLSVPPATPACYVLPMAEAASSNEGVDEMWQTITVQFAVYMAIRNGKTGGESLTDIDALRQSIAAALFAWTPAGADEPITFAGGEITDFLPGLLWWQDRFTTTRTLMEGA